MNVFPKAISKHMKLNNLSIVAFVKPWFWNLWPLPLYFEGMYFKLLDYSTCGLFFSG